MTDNHYQSSIFTHPTPQITLGCISPEARDLLDDAIAGWEEHKKKLPPDFQESVYSFAYWLIRWSGLVCPSTHDADDSYEGDRP